MKTPRIPSLIKLCLFILSATLANIAAAKELPTAQTIADRMKVGWNLGNTLEAIGGETAWGNPKATQTLINGVKAAGFNTVRLPCAWDEHATNGVIDPAWMARVKEVVDYCIAADVYVVLNIHWDNGWLEKHCTEADKDAVNVKQKNYWTQIAATFKDYDEHLLFASANEPEVNDSTGMSVLLSYHQTFVDAVRTSGGNNASRTLVIQGPGTDIEKTNTLMNSLPADTIDDRLMVEVHFYTPSQFCLITEDKDWGRMFYYWGKNYHSTTDSARNATWGEEAKVDSLFDLMKTKFIDKGIPVIIGEFGALKRNLSGENLTKHLASRVHYYQYCAEAAAQRGLILYCWDTGLPNAANTMGLFDRDTGKVVDTDVVDGVVSATAEDLSIFSPQDSLGGKWSMDWGWIDDSFFPWVFSYAGNNWMYVYAEPGSDVSGGYWVLYYTSDCSDYGWGFIWPSAGWWRIKSDNSSTWVPF
jgi:aryl-phospho-beta-D-glucosidase BglC (GH1 family)